jgi:hypothetical protein
MKKPTIRMLIQLRWSFVCILIFLLYPQVISSAEKGLVPAQHKARQQVMDIEYIQWQPNGNLIAVGEIFDVIIYTDSFQEVWRIPRPSAGFVESVAWSPDGSRIGIIYTKPESWPPCRAQSPVGNRV